MDFSDQDKAKFIKPDNKTLYYFKNIDFDQVAPAHYHIAIPISSDEFVMLTLITSQLRKQIDFANQQSIKYQESLVIVNPEDLSILSKQSVINCNNILVYTREELDTKIHSIEFKDCDIPEELINRLIKAIRNSPVVKERYKKLL